MGEGNPGMAITPEFYAEARRLTSEHGALLLVDSIQAGLRAHGVLSIIDYPGFEDLEAPDMETYSKALNAGQYPLSVLAMNERAAGLYRKGVYGNTMTTNPACAGRRLRRARLPDARAAREHPRARPGVPGEAARPAGRNGRPNYRRPGHRPAVQRRRSTAAASRATAADSIEEYMRIRGINVIHGGENSLRFTPHFPHDQRRSRPDIDATRSPAQWAGEGEGSEAVAAERPGDSTRLAA